MNKTYFLYLIAKFISSIGNWFQVIAFPIVIYNLTGSALAVSISFILNTLPIILLGPICGTLVDNYSRKTIMLISDLFRALALITIFFFGFENIPALYCLSFLLTIGSMFSSVCSSSLTPVLKGTLDLKKANTIEALFSNTAMIIGPILAGEIIFRYNIQISFLINAISFLGSFVILLMLPLNVRIHDSSSSVLKHKKMLKDIRKSFNFKYFLTTTYLKILLITATIFSLCGGIFMSLDAVYIANIFSNSPQVYGYINTAWGIGMLLTGFYLLIRKPSHISYIFFISIFIMGIATIGYGASKILFVSMFFNFLGGIANTLYMISFKTSVQENADPNNIGKIFSMFASLSQLGSTFLIGLAGILADVIGIGVVIIISGSITLLTSIIATVYYKLTSYNSEISPPKSS